MNHNCSDITSVKMILAESPSKPFEYTAKRTLRRAAMISLYEPEINAAYEAFEGVANKTQVPDSKNAETSSFDETLCFVRETVRTSVSVQIRDDEDIFRVGGGDRYDSRPALKRNITKYIF